MILWITYRIFSTIPGHFGASRSLSRSLGKAIAASPEFHSRATKRQAQRPRAATDPIGLEQSKNSLAQVFS
jgi:hypothetical protein